jgi:hypothetical protein
MSGKLVAGVAIIGLVRAIASIVVLFVVLNVLMGVSTLALNSMAVLAALIGLSAGFAALEHHMVKNDLDRWGPVKRMAGRMVAPEPLLGAVLVAGLAGFLWVVVTG